MRLPNNDSNGWPILHALYAGFLLSSPCPAIPPWAGGKAGRPQNALPAMASRQAIKQSMSTLASKSPHQVGKRQDVSAFPFRMNTSCLPRIALPTPFALIDPMDLCSRKVYSTVLGLQWLRINSSTAPKTQKTPSKAAENLFWKLVHIRAAWELAASQIGLVPFRSTINFPNRSGSTNIFPSLNP